MLALLRIPGFAPPTPARIRLRAYLTTPAELGTTLLFYRGAMSSDDKASDDKQARPKGHTSCVVFASN